MNSWLLQGVSNLYTFYNMSVGATPTGQLTCQTSSPASLLPPGSAVFYLELEEMMESGLDLKETCRTEGAQFFIHADFYQAGSHLLDKDLILG